MIVVDTKSCTSCHAEKSLDEFHRDKKSKDGRVQQCRPCVSKRVLVYNQANRERLRQKQSEYKARNPISSADQRARMLRRKYKLTPDGYDSLVAAQGYRCAICETELLPGRSHVDHDHRCCPGMNTCGLCIRGVLCNRCNAGIGYLSDEPERLDAAAAYLRRFQ